MSGQNPNERLSQISTLWTALIQGADVRTDATRRQAAEFLDRYQRAVSGYLVRAVHDPDRAAELFQEFALRYLKGDFRHVDRDRGRFRDYLRAVLINLVRRSHRTPPAAVPLVDEPAVAAGDPDDGEFLAHWRQTLLDIAWQTLETEQADGGPPYYSVLRLRADYPDDNSAALADRLTAGFPTRGGFTDAGVRKLLQRSREVFSDRVVAEVARSIPTRDRDRVAQELIDLGFFSFCRKALDRWHPQ